MIKACIIKGWTFILTFAKSQPFQFSIASLIIIAHFSLLIIALFEPSPAPIPHREKPLHVKTVTLKKIVPVAQKKELKVSQEKPKPIVKQTTKPKAQKKELKVSQEPPKSVVKQTTKPKAIGATKTVKKSSKSTNKTVMTVNKQNKILHDLRESIEKIAENDHNRAEMMDIEIPELSIDLSELSSETPDEDLGYQQELVSLLQMFLRLPEHGEVHIALTLNRDGTVKEVLLDRMPSEKNRSYVELTVPALSFPDFKEYFKGESEHKFLITLKSYNL